MIAGDVSTTLFLFDYLLHIAQGNDSTAASGPATRTTVHLSQYALVRRHRWGLVVGAVILLGIVVVALLRDRWAFFVVPSARLRARWRYAGLV